MPSETDPREKKSSVEANGAPAGGPNLSKRGMPPARKRRIFLAVGIIAAIAAVLGVRSWRHAAAFESTDDAYVDADIISISAMVPGQVQKVFVADNQPVKAGDPLVVLEDSTYRAKVAEARARVSSAE